jgi:hypothetical protein
LLLVVAMTTGLFVARGWDAAAAAEDPPAKYLSSDLADRMSAIIQGWGELGKDT